MLQAILSNLKRIPSMVFYGKVSAVLGLSVKVIGFPLHAKMGSRVQFMMGDALTPIYGEIIGFQENHCLVMPFGLLECISPGTRVQLLSDQVAVYPHPTWLGRVLNGLGEAVDDKPPLMHGTVPYALRATPPPAHKRRRVGRRIDVGVRAINTFTTLCGGQRMGIFAGSGVGKSVLLSQLAKFTDCDVAVIGLIGERGREVQEFIEDYLGVEGLKRSIVVQATSDEPALMRRQAAFLTLTMAEYFRDQGLHVLCLMDSVTRFAMAQREIGLACGEPPTTKGYPPTVFAEMPKLLERAGPGCGTQGDITGIFTVLVEGDDHNEPISDTVRGILDGHIVLERSIAERGRFPAMNILRSISRTMPDCNHIEEGDVINFGKRSLATYGDMEDLIRLGAYRKGSSADVDESIRLQPALEHFLSQAKGERAFMDEGFAELAHILGKPTPARFGEPTV